MTGLSNMLHWVNVRHFPLSLIEQGRAVAEDKGCIQAYSRLPVMNKLRIRYMPTGMITLLVFMRTRSWLHALCSIGA